MLMTQTPLLRRFWYNVARSAQITSEPFPFRLLGEAIVLWRDEHDVVHAVRDRCPHRTARLSQGWVEDGKIVCPYHGWAFDGAGTCVKVPQEPDRLRAVSVAAYACAERYNHVWVAMEEPLFDIPSIPEFDTPGYRQVIEFREDWSANPLRIMENGFDAAHLTFVHKNSFGSSDPAVRPPTLEPTVDGFVARNVVQVKTPDHMKAALSTTADRTTRTTDNRFYLPFSRVAKITYPSGLENMLCTFLTPIDDTRTLFTQWVVRNDTAEQVPPETVIAFDRQVTLEDRVILEGTDDDVMLDPTESDEVSMASDRPGLLMRKMLNTLIREHSNPIEPRIRQTAAV
jgi:phenylpropionate dioxygenase-like ring-hydroxylating dioxygenase large terminal subunit